MPNAAAPQVRCVSKECRTVGKKAIELHPVLKDPVILASRARVFQAFGNEVRLKIISLFAEQELCVCDIVTAMGGAASTLIHHLRMLEDAGVITGRKEGRFTLYSLNVELLKKHRVFE